MKQSMFLVFMTVVVLALAAISLSAAEPFTVIAPQQLKALIADKGTATLVIDSRSRGEYDTAHIPDAISLPLAQMTSLAFPRTSSLVFYCSGAT